MAAMPAQIDRGGHDPSLRSSVLNSAAGVFAVCFSSGLNNQEKSDLVGFLKSLPTKNEE
jgi:hypothetical protein